MSVAEEITRYNGLKNRVATATTAIATAITAKGGTVAQGDGLEDFASDIASIPSGSAYDIDDLIDGSITEIVSDVTSIRNDCFYELASLYSAKFPQATSLGKESFYTCSNLTYVTLPKAAIFGASCFAYCNSLKNLFLPSATWLSTNCLIGCSKMEKIVFIELSIMSSSTIMKNCSQLSVLVLNKDSITSLSYTNIFDGTPFAVGSSGDGGKVYVPSSLVSSYENATNWSALNCTFKEIAETAFSGDGITTTFTLTDNNAHPDDVFYIKIGNDFPEYTYDSTTGVITFVTAPASGTNNIEVYFKGVESV